MYIGARTLTLGCYAVMALWKNGENLRFIGGYAVCRMIVSMFDIASAAMYEDETMNMVMNIVVGVLFFAGSAWVSTDCIKQIESVQYPNSGNNAGGQHEMVPPPMPNA